MRLGGRTARLLFAGAAALLWQCAVTPSLVSVRSTAASDAPRVLILRSTANTIFDAPIAAYAEQMQGSATLLEATAEADAEALRRALEAAKPTLVFALGSRALTLARATLPSVPVVFVMVVNFRRHEAAASPHTMGVALEPPVFREFAQFKMVAAAVKRVLVFTTKDSSARIAEAREQLASFGAELVAVSVDKPEDVERKLAASLSGIDAVWLMNDPVVVNKKTFELLRDTTVTHNLPYLCSFSDTFAREGALMSVSVDTAALGAQAGAMTRMVLEQGRTPESIGVQPPISTKLVLNMRTAQKIGLVIPDDVLPLVNEVIVSEREATTDAESGEGPRR